LIGNKWIDGIKKYMENGKEGCNTAECRTQMIKDMFQAIEGTQLLLEQIQPDPSVAIQERFKTDPDRRQTAFKTLIATILSVRTKDETTFKVVEKLWQHYSTPKTLSEAPIEHLEQLVHSSGTYREKAKRIKEVARIIHQDYQDQVPASKEKLLELPGVGHKVANCVLVFSFGIPAIPVDTHVHRISNRTGWVKTKNPDQTEIELEKLFPQSIWTAINYTLVSFGKNVCKPINPLCSKCPVNDRCMQRIQPPSPKKKSTVYPQKSAKDH
jgi:endonuclease-3